MVWLDQQGNTLIRVSGCGKDGFLITLSRKGQSLETLGLDNIASVSVKNGFVWRRYFVYCEGQIGKFLTKLSRCLGEPTATEYR
jgi:hypothetical protein